MRAKFIAATMGILVLGLALAAYALPRSQLRGRPEIHIGLELGYFMWMDGNVLHIRWTTTNPENHSFRGEIVVPSGSMTDLARVSLEDSDRTELETPRRLVFNAVESRGLDGFDITLPGAATVKLEIDQGPASKANIFLGGRRKHPTAAGEIAIGAR
jgi:hypothetical protein